MNTKVFEEDGRDIVFVAGAPGSKWSAIAHALMYADGVNTSDLDLSRTYEGTSKALHFGNYFGPGMEFGDKFVDLTSYDRTRLLKEFALPYSAPGGIKLLKSHLFCRHLTFLAQTFPAASFLLVHRPDKDCLDWWTQAGGFSISFPDYSWYGNTDRMARQIALDNEGILSFAQQRGVALTRRRSLKPVLEALGLSYSVNRIRQVAASEFERRFGLGAMCPEEIESHCHATCALARVAVVRGHAASVPVGQTGGKTQALRA
jgi:hypothetical protein